MPKDSHKNIYLWIQDGWQSNEKSVIAEANAKSTMATARAAEVQLSFDSIRSPIDGRAGIINVFPGSLVQASNVVVSSTTSTATSTTGAMVTITQIDPINVQFIVAENNIPLLMQNDIANLKVSVTVGNNLTQIYEGTSEIQRIVISRGLVK